MSYKVDMEEVASLADITEATSNVLERDLHAVMKELDELISLNSFTGAAATNAKNYFESVHKTAIQSFQVISKQLATNIHTHIDTFKEDVDASGGARIEYNYVQEVKNDIQTAHKGLEDSVQNITNTLEDISHIISIKPPRMLDVEESKNNMVHTIDQLSNDLELFTGKGTDHDEQMKEMLHNLEKLVTEAKVQTGEARFSAVDSPDMVNVLASLGEANQVLGDHQAELRRQERMKVRKEQFAVVSEISKSKAGKATYGKEPNMFVSFAEVLLDLAKGGASGVYHLGEDFVLGVVQVVEDPSGTLDALASMVFDPVNTGYYIGKAINDSFFRDVIHGDAESRAHWFTYAFGSVFGMKGLGNMGKTGATVVGKGAQKAGQKLDELLPYYPRHQMAFEGPVPYYVFNGKFLRDELVVMSEKVSGSLTGSRARNIGQGTGKDYKNYRDVQYTGTTKVNGEVRDISRRVYQRLDIDYKRVDPRTGKTNYQLMKRGRPPIWTDGTKIELHHLIQREPGSMVEIPSSMHKEYDRILHGLVENGGSFRNDPVLKRQYENFRSKYWRWRAKQIDKAEL